MSRFAFSQNLSRSMTKPKNQLFGNASRRTNIHMSSHSETPSHPLPRPQSQSPPISNPEGDVYVLTLKTNPEHQKRMSELRTRYFPPHLLKIDAHITLFHALPHALLPTVTSDLSSLCGVIATFRIRATKHFRMARGVGVFVAGLGPVETLFAELQRRWWEHLTLQDRRKFRGHYTLMNKVDDGEAVQRCLEELESDFVGCEGMTTGLELWKYDRGWWQHGKDFEFSSASIA